MGSKNNSQTRFAQDLDMNVRLEKFSEGFRGLGFGIRVIGGNYADTILLSVPWICVR